MLPNVPLPNRTKAKIERKEVPFGVFLPILSPRLVEVCGIVGLDFVVIDGEGGPLDFSAAENLVRAAETVGITPIVRPLNHEPKAIFQYLNLGFQGLMVPGVDTAQQARDIVSAAKYPPFGTRGLGLARGAWYGLSGPIGEFTKKVNDEILIIAMIEHINAVNQIDDIVAVQGIDAFEIGGWDLSASMGHPGNTSHPDVKAAIDKIISTVIKSGRIISDTVASPDEARSLIAQGFRMLNCCFPFVAADALRSLTDGVRAVVKPSVKN